MTNSSGSRRVHVSELIGRCLRGVALVLFLAWPANPVFAQESVGVGILVVDMQRIQRDAAAAISVRAQSDAMRAELEKTIVKRAAEISREEAELAELRERLSASEFRARVRAFEEKVFANRDFAQHESGKLQSSLADASKRLRNRIAPILATLMRERKAQLMLDTSQVVLSADVLDVTEEVISRLNKAMPTMQLAPIKPPE